MADLLEVSIAGEKRFNKTLFMDINYMRCGLILPHEKWIHFFLGPWHLVCQFIEISNQIKVNGEVGTMTKILSPRT